MSSFQEYLDSTLPEEPETVFSEAIEEVEAETEAPAEATPVESEQADEGEAAASERKRILLREVLGEDRLNDLPESLRDADLDALVEDRKKAWAQAHKAGFDRNQFEQLQARYEAQAQVLEFIKNQQAQGQQTPQGQAQQPQPNTEVAELYQKYGVDPETGFYMDPTRFYTEVLPQINVELATRALQPKIDQISGQLQEMQWERFISGAQAAREQAYKMLADEGIQLDKQHWDDPRFGTPLLMQMRRAQLDPTDPTSHVQIIKLLAQEMPWLVPMARQQAAPQPGAPQTAKPKHENPPHATGAKASSEPRQQAGLRMPDGMKKIQYEEIVEMGRDMGLSDASIQKLLDEGPSKRGR